MTSLRLKIAGRIIRPVMRAAMRKEADPAAEREGFAGFSRVIFRAPKGDMGKEPEPRFERFGDAGLWVGGADARSERVILHIHGGGYVTGSPETHWKVAGHLSRAAGIRVFLPQYRLAPENPLTAGPEDARAAWDFLIGEGYAPGQIALGGDSAGGGIALLTLAGLLAEGTAPACVYLWSPHADHTMSGASVKENADVDHFFPPEFPETVAKRVLKGADPADPRISPLFAEFPSPPPVLLQAATCEILRDDSVRMAERLRAAGGEVTLELQEGAPHVWHMFHGYFPEAAEAVQRTGTFIARHLG